MRAERLQVAQVEWKAARADYDAAAEAELVKTARLRELRLERDRLAAELGAMSTAGRGRRKATEQ